jgi:hypothetical protein
VREEGASRYVPRSMKEDRILVELHSAITTFGRAELNINENLMDPGEGT